MLASQISKTFSCPSDIKTSKILDLCGPNLPFQAKLALQQHLYLDLQRFSQANLALSLMV